MSSPVQKSQHTYPILNKIFPANVSNVETYWEGHVLHYQIFHGYLELLKQNVERAAKIQGILTTYGDKAFPIVIDAKRLPKDLSKAWKDLSVMSAETEAQWKKQRSEDLKQMGENGDIIPFVINRTVSDYKLTPLHIAVMVGNLDAVKLLRQCGADANRQDSRGFTALHHAAIRSDRKILNALLAMPHDDALLTIYNGTWEKLYQLSHPNCLRDPSSVRFRMLDPNTKEISEKTSADFFKLTGAHFIDEMHMPADVVIEDWQEGLKGTEIYEIDHRFDELFGKAYAEWLQNPPKLCVTPHNVDEEGHKVNMGLGVFTEQPIKKGQMVCEYRGQRTKVGEKEDVEYLMERINARNFRDHGCIINTSFPNCMPVAMPKKDGVPLRSALIATEDIPAGAYLYIDYSDHDLKNINMQEMRYKSLVEIIRREGFDNLLATFTTLTDKKQGIDILELYRESYRRQMEPAFYVPSYLQTTPSTALLLLMDRVITPQQYSAVVNLAAPRHNYVEVMNGRRVIMNFAQAFLKLPPQIAAHLQQAIIKVMRDDTFPLAANICSNMTSFLNRSLRQTPQFVSDIYPIKDAYCGLIDSEIKRIVEFIRADWRRQAAEGTLHEYLYPFIGESKRQ